MRSFQVYGACFRRLTILLVLSLVLSALALAGNTAPPRISKQTREEVIHVFNEQLVYIRASFPMGKTGLKLKNGTVTPSGPELQRLMALWGPAAKPGDRARISDVTIKEDHIRFEINGGPVKKQKWYQHIQIQGTATVTPGGSDSSPSKKTTSALRSMAVRSRSRSGISTSRFKVRPRSLRAARIRPSTRAARSSTSTSTSMFRS